MKIIAPSHKKRFHNVETSTSIPFRCIADQLLYASIWTQKHNEEKVIYKKSIIDSLEAIKRGEEYGMLSVANKKKLQMS